ncbi:MAG: phenylacetate--CoA ligase family protein [Candidatus Bathyarchaeia archaeon]
MRNYLRAIYYLYDLMSHLHWSQEKLKEHQNRQLKKVINSAYESVPFYHRLFKENKIKPSDIRSIEDLNQIPVIRKEDMRKNIMDVISNKYKIQDLIKLETSGSTGKPFPVYITQKEDDYRKAKHLRANIYCGQRPWDRLVVLASPTHKAKVPKIIQKLGIYSWNFISVFEDIDTQISKLEKIKPDVIDGYSTSLAILAKEIEKRGLTTIKPRIMFGGAELLDDYSRKVIETVFNAPIYDQYAIVEVERISSQCPAKKRYHIDADAVILQFVDSTGEEISTRQKGEIICTSLFNYAMPIIRYAVGDIGASTDEECECGIKLPLMEIIEGRTDSFITLPDGRKLSPRMFNIGINLFEDINKIDQFKIIQKKRDLFQFFIKKKNEKDDEKIIQANLESHLRRIIKLTPEEVKFEIIFTNEIPLEKTGKLRAVISEIS